MKASLLFVMLVLTGCAARGVPPERPAATNTTVYRYSTPICEPSDTNSAQLEEAIKSRDEWKRYAESLEKLPAAKPRP